MAFFVRTALFVILSCVTVAATAQTAFPLGEPSFSAQLLRIDAESNLHFRTGDKVRVLPARELAHWGRYRDVESGPQIVLAGRGVIRADVLLVDQDRVVLGDATGLGRGQWDESSLPRSAVRGILLQPPAGEASRDARYFELAEYDGIDDRLVLLGGEQVSGTLTAAPRSGRFAPEDARPGEEAFAIARAVGGEPLSIPAAKIVAIQFGSLAAPPAASDDALLWVGLKDGSLLCVKRIAIQGDRVTLSLAAGGELTTTLSGRDDPDQTFWDAVTYVEPVASRARWLSSLEPIGYKHIPFLSIERPFGEDRSVLGTRLRTGDEVVRMGLGMPSASRLAYDVAGYRRFEAELAIDERAEGAGSVVFKVLLQSPEAQWSTAYESRVVRGGEAPVPISLELNGASRMALLVDFAERGDALDYANWLHARLAR